MQGVAGGEIGYVLQDRSIRTMQFLPGDTTYIFNFRACWMIAAVSQNMASIPIGNALYFASEDGFYSLARPASHRDRPRQGQRMVAGKFG